MALLLRSIVRRLDARGMREPPLPYILGMEAFGEVDALVTSSS